MPANKKYQVLTTEWFQVTTDKATPYYYYCCCCRCIVVSARATRAARYVFKFDLNRLVVTCSGTAVLLKLQAVVVLLTLPCMCTVRKTNVAAIVPVEGNKCRHWGDWYFQSGADVSKTVVVLVFKLKQLRTQATDFLENGHFNASKRQQKSATPTPPNPLIEIFSLRLKHKCKTSVRSKLLPDVFVQSVSTYLVCVFTKLQYFYIRNVLG